MSVVYIDDMFKNIIAKIYFDICCKEQYNYDLNKINPNDERIIENTKINSNNYITIEELEKLKDHYINEVRKGIKPYFNMDYYNNELYKFITSTNIAKIIPENTIYHLRKFLHNNNINGLNIRFIKYLDFMSLYHSGMIDYLKLNIEIVVVTREEQINNLPPFIKGLFLQNIFSDIEVINTINEKCPNLEYLDLGYSKIKEFNYRHKNLKTLICQNCLNLISIDTPSNLEYIDISLTKETLEHLKKFPSLKTIKIRRNGNELNYVLNTNNLSDIKVLYPYNTLNNFVYSNSDLLIKPGQISFLAVCNSNKIDNNELNKVMSNLMIQIELEIDRCNIDSCNTDEIVNNNTFDSNIDTEFIFKNIPSIENITLNTNSNIMNTKNTFDNLPSCKFLTVNNGRFEEGALTNYTSLESLKINMHNRSLPSNLIYPLNKLNHLTLNYCSIPKDFFKNAQALTHLKLYSCSIPDDEIFKPLINLKKLVILGTKISNKILRHLKTLKSLDVSWHSKCDVDLKEFSNLLSLKIILEDKEKVDLEKMFYGLHNLEKLSLSSSRTDHIIDTNIIKHMKNLKKLILLYVTIEFDNINSPLVYFEMCHCNFKNELIENLKKKDTLISIMNITETYEEKVLYDKFQSY